MSVRLQTKWLWVGVLLQSLKNKGDVATLCIEVFNAKSKNIFINIIYIQPAGTFIEFETYFDFLKNKTIQIT